MARSTPPDRLPQLIACATRVFIAQGYRRTQMADVAEALGVAKGTLYLYVASKEALFDLVVRSADGDGAVPAAAALPLPTPPAGATLAYVRERIATQQRLAALAAALARPSVRDARGELTGIVSELYDVLARNRHGIKLLDRSAIDHPELAALWFGQARAGTLTALVRYLEMRMAAGALPRFPDVAIGARILLETVVTWAVHRHWDAQPQPMSEDAVRAAVIRFVVDAFDPGPAGAPRRRRARGGR